MLGSFDLMTRLECCCVHYMINYLIIVLYYPAAVGILSLSWPTVSLPLFNTIEESAYERIDQIFIYYV